ncbi:hypothetical protein BZA77DRAFT_294468 [Pyronema omphalodes]|nr:hypothetical protein BZA77DRAFT_294468 [Pyronema omphalodes]
MDIQNTPPSVDENAWYHQGMMFNPFPALQEDNMQLRKELLATKAQVELDVFGTEKDFGDIMNCYNEINDFNAVQRQLEAEMIETENLKAAMERTLYTPQILDIEPKKEDCVSSYDCQAVLKNMEELTRRVGEIERQFHGIKKEFHDTTKYLAENLALITKEYTTVQQKLEQFESYTAVTMAVTDAALAEIQSGTAHMMLNEDGYFSRIMRLKSTPPGIIEILDETAHRNYVYIDCNRIPTIEAFEGLMSKAWANNDGSIGTPIKFLPSYCIQWPYDMSNVKNLTLTPCGLSSSQPMNSLYEITSIEYHTEKNEDLLSIFGVEGAM